MANIAIIGATGMVGRAMIEALERFNVNVDSLVLYASENSKDQTLLFNDRLISITPLTKDSIDDTLDYALCAVSNPIAKEYVPLFVEKGIVVIDNSSAFRMDAQVPLLIPEVNMHHYKNEPLIANPNCSTIQAVIALKVIDTLYTVKSVDYTTYQAVSGGGTHALRALDENLPLTAEVPITDNIIPQIDEFLDNGFTKEEMKMINETKKIMARPDLVINATCVRVPTTNAHGVNISVTTQHAIDLATLKAAFKNTLGIQYFETPDYPTLLDARNRDEVLVGRVRLGIDSKHLVHVFTVADNVRKGAATNAVQLLIKIMEAKL